MFRELQTGWIPYKLLLPNLKSSEDISKHQPQTCKFIVIHIKGIQPVKLLQSSITYLKHLS